jgi:hypothetical protein
MPYKSEAQRRFFHSKGAKRAGITSAMTKEYDKSSKGLNLPSVVHDGEHHHMKRAIKKYG